MTTPSHRAGPELVAESVRALGWARFRVYGVSMRPWLRNGDEVMVRREAPSRMRIGDVLVCARAGTLIAHRVVRRSSRGGKLLLITKGDAFPDSDSPVAEREVLGRVTQVVRRGRVIRLDRAPRRALGAILARVSACAWMWYPGARALKRLMLRS